MSVETLGINVAQLLKEPVGSSRSCHIEEYPTKGDINYIDGDLVLIRANRSIIVNGKMTASIKVVCSRCLKPIDCKVNFEFEEEAYPESAEGLSSDVQCDTLTIDEGNILDLSEAVGQYALLTLPAKPLCRPDCAGICPTCGHNLNEEPCQCHSKAIDPRWSKLIRQEGA